MKAWTVGHSNHPLERFVELLRKHEIEFAVDTRSYPKSRYVPHFNREKLASSLRREGIGYVYLGSSLGGRPEEHLIDDTGRARYDLMAASDSFRNTIERLLPGLGKHRVALVCSCGKPDDCHRKLLVSRVLINHGVEVEHILPDGTTETDLSGPDLPGTDTWRSVKPVR